MSRMSRMRQLANKALVRIEALAPENVQTASAENLGGFIRPRRKLSSPMLFRIISWSMVVSSLASIGCGIACLVSSQNEVLEFIVIATCSDGSAIWAGSFGFLCAILNLLLLRNHQNISGSSMKSVAFSSSFTTITSVASGPCQIFWILKSENEGVKASCEVGLVSALLMRKENISGMVVFVDLMGEILLI